MITKPQDRFFDTGARGTFGRAYKFGERRFGRFRYGREESLFFIGNDDTGNTWHGKDITAIERAGIYRRFTQGPTRRIVKNRYYIPSDPQTAGQLARRAVYAEAVSQWQSLTPPQKATYNQRAKGTNLSGYNLFVREWLNSH